MVASQLLSGLAGATIVVMTGTVAIAAAYKDPDWPCIQRKVPELSLGQIWNGPELPASAKDWAKDKDIAVLVSDLAARRVPLAEAQQKIRNFAEGLKPDRVPDEMTKLVEQGPVQLGRTQGCGRRLDEVISDRAAHAMPVATQVLELRRLIG